MKDILSHVFLPHESNNHRAKFLHHSSLLIIAGIVLLASVFVSLASQYSPGVLGISSNISIEDLLSKTNEKREAEGLPPLELNDDLSVAAGEKARDMFFKDYWAHNSPDGTTPWVFIKSSGYDYLYAGENLARGFTTTDDVVSAWMDSPGHRENILSGNYDDVGFAIADGRLSDGDTILIVQMFGRTKENAAVDIASAQEGPVQSEVVQIPRAESQVKQSNFQPESLVASVQSNPLVDAGTFSKTSSTILLSLLIGLLILDAVIIQRKNIVRILSHNLDHVIFLCLILIVVIIIGKGIVL